ncbi:MAG: hypothetical protein EP338_07365 [Bacteroidetes bacterium]|nr:MAG: hypothetical protein EP338_07365 [Bacteroidota bacterium]
MKHKSFGALLSRLFGRAQSGFYIQLGGFVLAFALSLFLTNFYGADEYGYYVLIFSTVEILAVFSMMGYNQLFSIHIPQFGNRKGKIASLYEKGRRATLRNSIIFMVLAVLATLYYPFKEEVIRYLVLCGAFMIPVLALSTLKSAFLYSIRKHFWTQLNERIFRISLFLLITFVLLWLSGAKLWHLIAAFSTSTVVSLVVVSLLKRSLFDRSEVSESFESRSVRNSIFLLVIINLIGVLFARTDTFMVAYFLGADYSGVNNIYLKIASVMGLLMSGAMVSASPKISHYLGKGQLGRIRRELRRVHFLTFPLGILMLIGIVLIAPFILEWYASEIYVTEVKALNIYSITALLDLFTGPAAVILMLGGKLKQLILGYSLEFVLNLILNAILIPEFQIEGAAWATLISELSVNLYFAYICLRTLRVNTLLIGN